MCWQSDGAATLALKSRDGGWDLPRFAGWATGFAHQRERDVRDVRDDSLLISRPSPGPFSGPYGSFLKMTVVANRPSARVA